MKKEHSPNPWLTERKTLGPHFIKHEHVGFNGRIAMLITSAVGTMWCAYLFAAIALISLPAAIHAGTPALISWILSNASASW